MEPVQRVGLGIVAFLTLGGSAAADQQYHGGHLRDVQPGVLFQQAESADAEEAVVNLPFLTGDRIWTDADGLTEIQLSSDTLVRLDHRSKLDLGGIDQSSAFLHLWSGAAFIVHPGGAQVSVLVPGGRVVISQPGRYRLDVYRGDVRVWSSRLFQFSRIDSKQAKGQ